VNIEKIRLGSRGKTTQQKFARNPLGRGYSQRGNACHRRVVHTGPPGQLVLMNIQPEGAAGEEKQEGTDTMLFIVNGKVKAILNERARDAGKYDVNNADQRRMP
jgi:hypothetical protein